MRKWLRISPVYHHSSRHTPLTSACCKYGLVLFPRTALQPRLHNPTTSTVPSVPNLMCSAAICTREARQPPNEPPVGYLSVKLEGDKCIRGLSGLFLSEQPASKAASQPARSNFSRLAVSSIVMTAIFTLHKKAPVSAKNQKVALNSN